MNKLVALEDRVLELQDRVDVLSKEFNPNQPRDERGRWSAGGAGGSTRVAQLALDQYTGLRGNAINAALRSGKESHLTSIPSHEGLTSKELVTAMDKLIAGYKLTKPLTVYRGLHQYPDNSPIFANLKVGDVLQDRGFSSTSRSKQYASRFTRGAGLLMRIKLPVGSTALDIKRDVKIGNLKVRAALAQEREILLPRDAKLRLDRVRGNVFDFTVVSKADKIAKVFDPNQPRAEDGKWADAGGGGGGTSSSLAPGKVRSASSWLTPARVKQAVLDVQVTITPKTREAAKNVAATVAAALITQFDNSDLSTDAVKTAVLNLADGMKVTASQARDHLVKVMEQLKKVREKEINKASDDPTIKLLDAILAKLKALKFENEDVIKLEDRMLILQDRIDVVKHQLEKAGFQEDQPRDESGKWSETGGAGGGASGETEAQYQTRLAEQQSQFIRTYGGYEGKQRQHEREVSSDIRSQREAAASKSNWSKWAKNALLAGAAVGAVVAAGYLGHQVYQNHQRVLAIASTHMRLMGVDPNAVNISWDPTLGPFGMARSNGTVTLWPNRIKLYKGPNDIGAGLRTTMVHEATHIKAFSAFKDTKIVQFVRSKVSDLAAEGGVTPYSEKHWDLFFSRFKTPQQVRLGLLNAARDEPFIRAVHETLSEMSAVKQKTGKLPGGPTFKQLHSMIMNHGKGEGFVML